MGWLARVFGRWSAGPTQKATGQVLVVPGRDMAPTRRMTVQVPTISQVVASVGVPTLSPCPPEIIDAAADQVVARFAEENEGSLGSFPEMATRIMDILAVPDPDFNKLVHALGQDIAITAKLLQVANSALYSRGESSETVRAAVVKLGLREVAQLAIGLAGRSLFETTSRVEYSLFPEAWDRLFHDAMTSAFSAGRLSLLARVGRSDNAFLAGMLHDVGKPVALHALAALMLDGKLDKGILDGGVDSVIERVHVEIGTALTAGWQLPAYLQACAAHHHDEEAAVGLCDEVHIVRVVDGLKFLRAGAITEVQRMGLRESAAALQLDGRMMRVSANEQVELAARVTEIFGVADPSAKASKAA